MTTDSAIELFRSKQLANLAFPIHSLDAYIASVQRAPMLSQEEEQTLAKQLLEQNDIDAARRLVLSHLRFVVKIARGYSGYGLGLADLIQEGNVGLMKAIKRFDPEIGVRLVSFAVHWIKAEIHEFIIRNWRIVKVATTKAQRKLFFNLRRNKRENTWFTPEEAQDVAETLHVSRSDVQEMEKRLAAYDSSFDSTPDDESDNSTHAVPANFLEDKRYDPALLWEKYDWEKQNAHKFHRAFTMLDKRSQLILQQRWLSEEKATLQTLAEHFAVSAERIRQLENEAIKKLRKIMFAGELVAE